MTVKEQFELLKSTLGFSDLEELQSELDNYLQEKNDDNTLANTIAESRFSEGLKCPHCESKEVIKHGTVRGKQRFYCKECQRTFGITTGTIFENSKLSMHQWSKYIDCMTRKLTLRKCKEEVKISLKTAFFMRHKILFAIVNNLGIDELDGITEMDETFFAESFKGNHNRQKKEWIAPRNSKKSRKRGKEVDYRGISHEQICVSTAMGRKSGLVASPVCKGRLTTQCLLNLYTDKIEPQTTICTDSHKAYPKFAEEIKAELHQIESGKHKKGVLHINHINSLHSQLKNWIIHDRKGVATKFLNNYLLWHTWNTKEKSLRGKAKANKMFSDSIVGNFCCTRQDIRESVAFS
ncbi:MAG: IS1595 family transposase [Eubacteriales bacterium]